MDNPRDADEAGLAAAMERWVECLGLRAIPVQVCARRGPHGNRRLDILATSADCASRWAVQR
eukprot:4813505-Lingulodinium_polyedra.AAC.1